MAVTSYKISILKYTDCPIRYDNPNAVLDILKCWRNNHTTENVCSKCLKSLSFSINFTTCCNNFYFKPIEHYVVQSLAIYTPRHTFLPKNLKDQLKKLKIKTRQNFIVLPDPIYWQISSTLVYEFVLKYVTGKNTKKYKLKKRSRADENAYMYSKLQSAFINHGSLNQRSEGKNTYFRKIALAKRTKLMFRAVAVPAPYLNPNEIIIPQFVEQKMKLKGKWLLVNRMPSLLPENMLALKVVGGWNHYSVGLNLQILPNLQLDFDGDIVYCYILQSLLSQAECEVILNSENTLSSFTMGLKLSPNQDMLVVYYLKYNDIHFLPYKTRNLSETFRVIHDLYGPKVCFNSIVQLKNYYLNVMQNDMLFCITYKEIEDLETLCKELNFEDFEILMQNLNPLGCLTTQILANAKGSFFHAFQLFGAVGYQYARNSTITLNKYIKSSFLRGLSPIELAAHAQAGIDAFISSSNISSAGYNYFKLIHNLHPWTVNYKGEVVDGSRVVVEDVANLMHFEDFLAKPAFTELISQHLTDESKGSTSQYLENSLKMEC